jgi:hypothetical protein
METSSQLGKRLHQTSGRQSARVLNGPQIWPDPATCKARVARWVNLTRLKARHEHFYSLQTKLSEETLQSLIPSAQSSDCETQDMSSDGVAKFTISKSIGASTFLP